MSRDPMEPRVWRCQCPDQCEDGESCWSDVTQEDFLCDWCRQFCRPSRARLEAALNP